MNTPEQQPKKSSTIGKAFKFGCLLPIGLFILLGIISTIFAPEKTAEEKAAESAKMELAAQEAKLKAAQKKLETEKLEKEAASLKAENVKRKAEEKERIEQEKQEEEKRLNESFIIWTEKGKEITTTLRDLTNSRGEALTEAEITAYRTESEKYAAETPEQRKTREQHEEAIEKEYNDFEKELDKIKDLAALISTFETLLKQQRQATGEKAKIIATKIALMNNQFKYLGTIAKEQEQEKHRTTLRKKLGKAQGIESEQLQEKYNILTDISNAQRVKKKEEKRQAKQAAEKQLEQYFSGWNGSCTPLTSAIKEILNDPDSYSHVKTTYSCTTKPGTYIITCIFRAKNTFGALVLTTATCNLDASDGSISTPQFE